MQPASLARPAQPDAARPHRPASFARSLVDFVLGLGVLALAALIRIPYLLDAPTLTDETEETRWAFRIARGEILPLVSVEGYLGPWHAYLTALAFHLGGYSLEVARGVPLVLGILTVLLTYGLARAFGIGRSGATLAGALLAVNGAHTLIASHIAWSNCTTAFYTTLAALLLVWSLRRDRPRWLVAVGAACGLALQTHPTALPILLAVLGQDLIARRGAWLRSRWTWLGLLAFLVVYSPVILHNLLGGFSALEDASRVRGAYTNDSDLSAGFYLRNAGALLIELGQMLAGGFLSHKDGLGDPAVYPAWALALAGLAWAVWRRFWLAPLALLLSLLILPWINPLYDVIEDSRFIMPLLPLILVAEGGLAEAVIRWSAARLRSGRARSLAVGALVAAIALSAWSLVTVERRLARFEAEQPPYNRALFQFAQQVVAARRPDEMLLLDERLETTDKEGPQNYVRVFSLLFDFAGLPNRVVDIEQLGHPDARWRGERALLVSGPTPPLDDARLRERTQLDLDWDRPDGILKIRAYRIVADAPG